MPPKKRGRKPKKVLDTQQQEEKIEEPKKIHKKRGRKPKGGKIIKNISEQTNATETNKQNIILQLKCSSKDLKSQSKKLFPNEVYEKDETVASYPINNIKQNGINYKDYNNKINYLPVNKKDKQTFGEPKDEESVDLKEIWEKLRFLLSILREANHLASLDVDVNLVIRRAGREAQDVGRRAAFVHSLVCLFARGEVLISELYTWWCFFNQSNVRGT